MGEPANGAAYLPRNGRRIIQFCFAEEKTDLQKVYETRNGYQRCHVRFAVGKHVKGLKTCHEIDVGHSTSVSQREKLAEERFHGHETDVRGAMSVSRQGKTRQDKATQDRTRQHKTGQAFIRR